MIAEGPLSKVQLRPYRPEDAPRLLSLFRNTIRRINCRDYTAEQIAAWASDDIDPGAWAARFEGRFVVVAEDAGGIPVGFAELAGGEGTIDRFYVSADHQGRGIGRRMLEVLLSEADRIGLPRLLVEASLTARPFFERQGFEVIAAQEVNCRGVTLVNFRMRRERTDRTVVGEH